MALNLPKNIDIGLPPQIKNPHNPLFESILLVIVCALFTWFILLPKRAAYDLKQAQVATISAQESKIKNDSETLIDLINKLKNDPSDVQELDKAMPLRGSTIDTQLLIESLANASGVTIGNVNISGRSDAVVAGDPALVSDPFGVSRTLQKLSGSVVVAGTFPQLEAFLKKLENSDRILEITALSISGSGSDGLSLQVTLNAYYFAP